MVANDQIVEPSARDVRSALVEALERLLAVRPVEAISVRDITAAAKVSNPTLYYHFGTKDAFYWELLRERMSSVTLAIAAAHEASQSLPAISALRVLSEAFTTSVSALSAPQALLHELLGARNTEMRRAVFRAERAIREYFELAIGRGLAAGEIRAGIDPRTAAVGIVGALSLFAARALAGATETDDADPLRFVFEVVIPGLESRAAQP